MSLCVKRSPSSINHLQLIHLLQFHPFSTSPPPPPPSFIVSRSETNSHENPSTFRSFLRWVSGIVLGLSVGLVGYLSSSEKSFLAFADWSTPVTAEVSVDDHQTSNPKFLFEGTFRKFKENYAHQNPFAHETKSLDNSMEDFCANIKVPKYMKAPIYIYYQLDNYYQNHRCHCLPIVPCGLIAWSLFNDTYSFSRGTEELKVNRKNIAWKSDRYHKFGKQVYPFNFQNGTLIGGGNLDPNIPVSFYREQIN
ncbi:cell division control protein 50-like [Camellia sinensis]|uniref:cell division control protein 50-like n=1 Tax=Camellia sinensis TaxID=4442 RepID=UPI0010365140|nr:cell division control protein 50-like [Camellia sinensis]